MMITKQKTIKRTVVLFAATLLALVVFSGVALAVTPTRTTNPCEDTSGADTLYERAEMANDPTFGADTIHGRGGDDDIITSEDPRFSDPHQLKPLDPVFHQQGAEGKHRSLCALGIASSCRTNHVIGALSSAYAP